MTEIFVLDTNCLISALLLPGSVTRKAFNKIIEKGIIVHSKETFAEFAGVIMRPKFDKYLSLGDRLNLINLLEQRSLLIEVSLPVIACRDPKDDKFLSLAIASGADCIISGDKDLLSLHPFREIPIMAPSIFLNSF